MAKSKRQKRLEVYGNEQVTVPLLMPPTRYDAFKRLVLGRGKHINKVLRDLIEEAYGEELDRIEHEIFLESSEHESTSDSFKAHERMAS